MYEARLKMLTKFMQRNMFHNCANYKSMASTNNDFSTSPKGSLLLNSFCNVQTGIGSGHMFKSPSNDWEIRTTLKIPWVIMRPYEYLITFSLVSSGSPTQVKCPINTSTVIQRYLNFTVNGFQYPSYELFESSTFILLGSTVCPSSTKCWNGAVMLCLSSCIL